MIFNIGDRVEMESSLFPQLIGKQGTIVAIPSNTGFSSSYGVYFDDDVNGWGDLSLSVPLGHGLWIQESHLKLLGSPKEGNLLKNYLQKNNITEQEAIDALIWYFGK